MAPEVVARTGGSNRVQAQPAGSNRLSTLPTGICKASPEVVA